MMRPSVKLKLDIAEPPEKILSMKITNKTTFRIKVLSVKFKFYLPDAMDVETMRALNSFILY